MMSDMDDDGHCCDGGCDHLSQYSGSVSQPSLMMDGCDRASSPGDCCSNTDGEASYIGGAGGSCSGHGGSVRGSSICPHSITGARSYSTSPPRNGDHHHHHHNHHHHHHNRTGTGGRYDTPHLPRRTDFGEYFPDGGWGWTVCGAAFIVHFLCHGFHLAAGTLIVEVQRHFKHTSQAQTG